MRKLSENFGYGYFEKKHFRIWEILWLYQKAVPLLTCTYDNVSEHTNNRPEMFFKKVFCSAYILRIPITGEYQCERMISIKLLCETTLSHCWSPVNLQYIYRISFLKNTSGENFREHLLFRPIKISSVKTMWIWGWCYFH